MTYFFTTVSQRFVLAALPQRISRHHLSNLFGQFDKDADKHKKQPHQASDELPLPAYRIVLADDDADDRDLFEEALKRLNSNIQLELAEDGNDLLKRLNDTDKPLPDLIFLDLNMPARNGIECLEMIRNTERLENIKVVIFSTSSSATDIRETFEKGANLYVNKPASFQDLYLMTRKVLALNWDKYKPNSSISRFIYSSKTN